MWIANSWVVVIDELIVDMAIESKGSLSRKESFFLDKSEKIADVFWTK